MSAPIDTEQLLKGDVRALSKAITLVESVRSDHRKEAISLLERVYNQRKKSIRIGITGIPGVGKSTFIEQLGNYLNSQGLKVAVLAVDPSSTKTKGSILGDKTRMEELSKSPNAFIRPSPSSGTLGGIATRTRETMLLCEAAGYDVIIVETVGVGQSETEVIHITDCFVLLAMPGTGDELQGIKRGIMEAADIIVINKADGEYINAAKRAKKQLEMALHLFPASEYGWNTKVLTASAMLGDGINKVWETIQKMQSQLQENDSFELKRRSQQIRAFEQLTALSIYEYMLQEMGKHADVQTLKTDIDTGKTNEFSASLKVLKTLEQFKIQ